MHIIYNFAPNYSQLMTDIYIYIYTYWKKIPIHEIIGKEALMHYVTFAGAATPARMTPASYTELKSGRKSPKFLSAREPDF